MLKLYNKEHIAISALTNLKDYKLEYVLSGEDSLEFSLSIADENINLVEEEGYIRTKNNEYVIKAIDPSQGYKRYNCVVNVESIKGKSIKNFDTSNNSITETIRLAIAGTGWILADNNITKRRTVRLENTDALEVLREVRKVFRVDFRFDAINKIIHVYENFGTDKGVYFSDELNLIDLQVPSETYNYATRLYCYGKEGLSIKDINNGKEYIENFQYSKKVVEKIWKDERYTIIENLKEDGEAKLEELSKPKRSYQADIADLAKLNDEYNFLDFFLGDTITLLSKSEKFRDKQRIVKYIEYPDNPSQNTCELGNTTLTFEELQKENEAKNQVVDNITIDNNTVNGSTIDGIRPDQIYDFEASVARITNLSVINADIKNLQAVNVNITGELNSVKARIGTFEANVATIDKLTVTHSAYIADLQASKADITQFEAVNASIKVLEADVGKIKTLVNGNLSSENIQAGGITSDKLTISNGFIKNVMIESLDVNKINAGDIITNKFRIKSDDGGIEIVGATQQFKDKNNKVRIQMGKDTQGNFNFIIRGEDGTTTLIDHTGVKSKAIANDLIISNMIASDAVGEKQINYSSFTNGFNKDTNTTTLKATKIKLDNQNQTLDVAFNSLKTQADGTKSLTESHSTTIDVMQGQINTAISNTQITKDGKTILLKDDYNRTIETVKSINSTLGSHTTQINEATGKIESVNSKFNTVQRDLDGINERLSSTTTDITTVTNLANGANKKIDSFQSEVTTINNKVVEVQKSLSGINSRVSTVESNQTTVNDKVVWLEAWKKEAEQKITDDSIVSVVSKQFYSKGECDTKYTTQSTLTQLVDSFEFEFRYNSNNNLLKNSAFLNQFDYWGFNGSFNKSIYSDGNFNQGNSVILEVNQENQGLFQSNIDCSNGLAIRIYAQASRAVDVAFGIEGVNVKVVRIGEGSWTELKLIIPPTNKVGPFIFYTKAGGPHTIYANRFKVQTGGTCTPWHKNSDEIYSNKIRVDNQGITIINEDGSYSKTSSKDFGFYSTDNRKHLGLYDGALHTFNPIDGREIGYYGSIPFPGLGDYGLAMVQESNSWIGFIKRETTGELLPQLWLNFHSTGQGNRGTANMKLNLDMHGGAVDNVGSMRGNPIIHGDCIIDGILKIRNIAQRDSSDSNGIINVLSRINMNGNQIISPSFAGSGVWNGNLSILNEFRIRNLYHTDGGSGYSINVWSRLNLMEGTNFSAGVFAAAPMASMFLKTLVEKPVDILDSIEFIDNSKMPRFNSLMALTNQEDEVKEEYTGLLMDVSNIIGTPYASIDEKGNVSASYEELLKLALKEIKELKNEVSILKEKVGA